MWCDIKNTKYSDRLTGQLGERNAQEYSLGIDSPKFKNWFGNGKTTTLENGTVVPFVNPIMQVINQDGKQMNLMERYKFQGLSDVTRLFSTSYTPGIINTEGTSYKIANDGNRFINNKFIEEIDRLYPGLVERGGDSTFSINQKYQFEMNPAVEKSVQLINEVRDLSTSIKGEYKETFDKDPTQALYEIAQQANRSESERNATIKAVGERVTEIAQQLFPTADHQISYQAFDKRKVVQQYRTEKWDNDPLTTLLNKLSNRFNIATYIADIPGSNLRGQFTFRKSDGQMQVMINRANIVGSTPFHEFLHPFIRVLNNENYALYSALVAEMKTNQRALAIWQETNNNSAYKDLSPSERMEEAMVQYLGHLSEEKYDQKQSVFNRFINWLKSLFKKMNMINFQNLSLNTTLDQIADMMVDDLQTADLKALMRNSESITNYQKTNLDSDITFGKVFDKIKDRVAILNATIKKRKSGDQFREDIAALNDIINNENEITSINNFVANSLNYVDSAYNRFNTLRDAVKDPSKLSKEDIAYNLGILGEIQQLLNVFDAMSDAQLLYIKEGATYKDDTMAKLAEAIAKKDIMVADYKNFALSFVTEWLYPYIEPTNAALIAKGNTKDVLTKEQFRDQMIMATRDIDSSGYFLGAVINSQDAISAAVALALKDVVYDNHLKDLHIGKELQEAYDKVRSTPLYSTKKGEEDFNMQFLRQAENYEQVGVDENGQAVYGYVNRLAFHTEYLEDQFDKDRKTFYKNLGEKPKQSDRKAYKEYQRAVSKFYSQNTRINPNTANIIDQKRKELSRRQFEKWLLNNTKVIDNEFYSNGQSKASNYKDRIYTYNNKNDTFRIFSGDLVLPAEKYKNPDFGRMMTSDYYKTLFNSYQDANEKLGTYGLKYGIIPQESKGKNAFSDINWSKDTVKKNLLDAAKAPIRSLYANYDSDRTVQRQDGTEVKHIPIKYTKLLDQSDLKVDLLSSTMKFSQMANHFEGMSEVEPNILVLKTVLNGDYNLGIKGRQIAKTNAKGIAKLNAITQKVVPKMAREDMLNARLNEFIDDIVFGDAEFKATVNILGRDFSVNKIADNAGFLTTVTNMALNFTGGVNNVIVGNYNNALEAMGGRFWGKKDWLWGNGQYWKLMPEVIGEIAGQTDSIMHEMAEHYDIPQGEFKNEYGQDVTTGKLNKLFRSNSLMFMQKGGEHQIQLSGMLSLMHATKVTTKDGKEIHLFDAWNQKDTNGDRIPITNNPNINWTAQDDSLFRNRLHAINKSLHGVYNKFDKAVAQRRWYGKLGLMFRKYMFTAFKSRYGRKYVDYELGTTNEGYWNTFMKKVVADAKDYKFGMLQRLWTKEGYNEDQKNAINRTVFEFGVILAAMLLAGFSNEDDDKSWITSEAKLQLTRMSADITQYISPADFIRVVRNPAASINLIEKYTAVAQQLTSPTEEYSRASGFAKQGDNKLYIKMLKALPGIRQVINTMTPDEQIKYYNLPGTK